MSKLNSNLVLLLIIFSITILTYVSYQTGYKASKNNLDALLMTMTIDSNIVTSGLYEELPNNVRRTLHFYIEDSPSDLHDIKMFAEVKYVTIGGKVINIENGNIWKILKEERIFQRQFNNNSENKENPESPFAVNEKNRKNLQ